MLSKLGFAWTVVPSRPQRLLDNWLREEWHPLCLHSPCLFPHLGVLTPRRASRLAPPAGIPVELAYSGLIVFLFPGLGGQRGLWLGDNVGSRGRTGALFAWVNLSTGITDLGPRWIGLVLPYNHPSSCWTTCEARRSRVCSVSVPLRPLGLWSGAWSDLWLMACVLQVPPVERAGFGSQGAALIWGTHRTEAPLGTRLSWTRVCQSSGRAALPQCLSWSIRVP